MVAEPILELPVLWSRVAEAVRFWGSQAPKDHGLVGDETSCVLAIREHLRVTDMRDWLHREIRTYEVTGFCFEAGAVPRKVLMPFALRFRFSHFDDKLLFALRWL